MHRWSSVEVETLTLLCDGAGVKNGTRDCESSVCLPVLDRRGEKRDVLDLLFYFFF